MLCRSFTDSWKTPMFEGSKIRIMPDVHAGMNIVIGFTVPFANHVNPDHVGGDIGCSVSTAITNIPVNKEDCAAIERQIRENVKFGMDIHDRCRYSEPELYKFIQTKLNDARRSWPEMVIPMTINEKEVTAMLKRLDMDGHGFYHSIGTVGGGNHFVEVGVTPDGNYAFTAHCGSRHFGQKVWKYWHVVADKETANGFLIGENMRGYITDMVISQAYAEYNHKIIDQLVFDAITLVSGSDGEIVETIYTTHNYIDFAMKMIRKGAVSAAQGERLVIPFNMRDGLIICRGKGNDEWNQSAPHGAGRLMSRSDAKELIDLDEYRESMKDVYTTSVGVGTIDESPMAYKDPKEILRQIEDTVEIEYFIRPVINLKATVSFDSKDELEMDE